LLVGKKGPPQKARSRSGQAVTGAGVQGGKGNQKRKKKGGGLNCDVPMGLKKKKKGAARKVFRGRKRKKTEERKKKKKKKIRQNNKRVGQETKKPDGSLALVPRGDKRKPEGKQRLTSGRAKGKGGIG